MGYTSGRLRVLIANGRDFPITPREMTSIADQLDEKDAEIAKLRAAILVLPEYAHPPKCRGFGTSGAGGCTTSCTCGVNIFNADRAAARKLAGEMK